MFYCAASPWAFCFSVGFVTQDVAIIQIALQASHSHNSMKASFLCIVCTNYTTESFFGVVGGSTFSLLI